jgi:hypothetical protein
MNSGGKRWLGRPFFRIRTVFMSFIVCSGLFCLGACSNNEQKESKGPKVVVPIKRITRKIPPAPPVKEKEKGPVDTEPVLAKNEVTHGVPTEDKKEASDRETITLEPKKPAPPSTPETPKKPEEKKVEGGLYTVKEGDTLYNIAGKKEVYGDSLRWPSLLRLNRASLDKIGMQRLSEHDKLPVGCHLKYLTPREVEENLTKWKGKSWAVNIASSQTSEKFIRRADTLVRNGFHVYITPAKVKGTDWLRLRVGFFDDRQEATAAGKRIESLMNAPNWVTKIDQTEFERFAGY